MEPMTMPAMAPPERVLASVGSSSSFEEEPEVVLPPSVTMTWRPRRRRVVVSAAARWRSAVALGRVMGAMLWWVRLLVILVETTESDLRRQQRVMVP